MLVFIDESGDPGFKLPAGSSQLFVVGMVIFNTSDNVSACQQAIDDVALRLGHKPEFKFGSCRDEVKDAFFDEVVRHAFQFRCLVIDKPNVWSPHLRSNKDRFYNYFVQLLLKHHSGVLANAKVVIDGSGGREFRSNLTTYVRQQIPKSTISRVSLKNSKSDRMLQLADMCVGAIYRSRRHDAKRSDRWSKKLRPRITDIWNFE